MSAPQDWIPTDELLTHLSEAGYPTTERQLERWRNEKLLPQANQENVYKGSVVWHPRETEKETIAIRRCLGVKNRFDFAGPLLWAAGFEVGERYYARHLVRADQLLRGVRPLTRGLVRMIERSNPDRTLGDALGRMIGLTGILAKVFRRIDDVEKPRFTNVVADVASGEFDHFDAPATDREISTAEVVNRGFGFEQVSKDQILGARLRLGAALEAVLREISEIQGAYRLRDFSPDEIRSARDDVRNALKIGICLYDALAWIYGPGAFGLRLIAYMARTIPTHLIYLFTLTLARMRKNGAEIYKSDEIADFARQAECVWLIPGYLRDIQNSRPDLAYLVSPRRMKIAFSDRDEYRKLLKDLERYQFPAPEFKPWNSWQKLAKKTMGPGLLAMSIGSPEQISFEEVMAGASGSR